MASVRGTGQPAVGSSRWVYDEREVAQQFINQEVEEFAFSARTEMEWLNEHMADILSENQFNIAEAFKTPGKLRGKTPRTARKLPQSAARAPLTDIFSSNRQLSPSPTAKSRPQQQAPAFQVAEDKENVPAQAPSTKSQTLQKFVNTDSGYHGTVGRDSLFREAPLIPPKSPLRSPQHKTRPQRSPKHTASEPQPNAEDTKDSEESFVSADEAPSKKPVAGQDTQDTELATQEEEDADNLDPQPQQSPNRVASHPFSVSAETAADMEEAAEYVERTSPSRIRRSDKQTTPSDTSSPERPVIRKKSSLNLASLPPRDPLTTKKSFGTTPGQGAGRDSARGFSTIRDSYLNRNKQSQGPELSQRFDNAYSAGEETLDLGGDEDQQSPHQLETTMLHNKTSTQRLHERINMLGKSNPSRPSKSIPSVVANAQTAARKTDTLGVTSAKADDDKDDDWIAPMPHGQDELKTQAVDEAVEQAKEVTEQTQPSSTTTLYPSLSAAAITASSTTPAGSPTRAAAEGPLSASKARFQSFLRSAKGMFASSAATSAQAKMETMAPSPSRPNTATHPQSIIGASNPKQAQVPFSKATARKRSASEGPLREELETSSDQPPAKRRSSQRVSEKQVRKEAKDQPVKINESNSHETDVEAMDYQPYQDQSKVAEPNKISQPPLKKLAKPVDQQSKPSDAKRPKQIARPNTAAKAKPGQISVMVPSMRPQLGASSNASKSTTQQSAAGQSSSTARPPLTKKASDSSLRSVSSQSIRPGQANAKLKALESARRKKEQDEREQQRKEEQKKAIEKKRAEKAEEERQANERKAAEQKRDAEARAAAQKRAAEQQKAEKQQREEQLRAQAEAAKSKPANDLMSKSQTDRFPAGSKTEKVPVRPESRGQESGRPLVPHVNPAKPVKRYFNPDAEDQRQPPQSAAQQPPFAAQKKPQVSEEFELRTQQQPLARPAMGAPMRPSFAKKQELPAKFQHGFMANPNPNPNAALNHPQTGNSMLKSAINTSQQMQGYPKTPGMNDMTKYSTARIPFAEASNPPGPQQPQSSYAQPARPTQKTPGTAKSTTKSSPAFPNGDNISLPEIATDSEDEDSDDAFEAPAWTNSPELRQLLEQQQLVDPMRVFGPIAPLSMDEVFKGVGKDRLKRFRDRTSSANWNGPDRLTEEERKRDREARERLEREGGWTYETGQEVERGGRA